jgi:regulator of protease activity HflC (stomatin/prohibitin superfamily)
MKGQLVAIVGIMVIVFLAVIAFSSVVIVPAGERGILFQFGAITGVVFDEGLSFKTPIVQGVELMDIKTQKIETIASSASKDLQIVTTEIALNYRIKPDSVAWIRQNIGSDYRGVVIDPAIQESVKAATSQFNAEELITKRESVRELMKAKLQEKMDNITNYGVVVQEFNIKNFEFSKEFDAAIEAKQTAEQLALKAKNDLERIKFEAQQKIEQATAEATSLRIQSEAIKESKEVLQLRAIEKWSGVMPLVYMSNGCSSSSNPMILDIDSLLGSQ